MRDKYRNEDTSKRFWVLMVWSGFTIIVLVAGYAYFVIYPDLAEKKYIISHLEIDKIKSMIIEPYQKDKQMSLIDEAFDLKKKPDVSNKIITILKRIKPFEIGRVDPNWICIISIEFNNYHKIIKYEVVNTTKNSTFVLIQYSIFGYDFIHKVYKSDELASELIRLFRKGSWS